MRALAIFILFCSTATSLPAQSFFEVGKSNDPAIWRAYLQKHDINSCVDGESLLTGAINQGNVRLAKMLVDGGADVNLVCDEEKATALMAAAKNNQIEIGKLLVMKGADVEYQNKKEETALLYARVFGNYRFAEDVFNVSITNFMGTDGPHIFETDKGYEVFYVRSHPATRFDISKRNYRKDRAVGRDFTVYDPTGGKLFSFPLRESYEPYPDVLEMPEKLIAISDIEGNFEAFENLLKSTGVMNKDYEWTFGQGHLVLVGDFFDRGNMVTECLWLIYKLEQEAEKAGGMVHFIIGNHEDMNLRNDIRYVSEKYIANAVYADRPYVDFFSEDTVLGKWLRSKNAMVKIGRVLFLHGGISPVFADMKIPISEVNEKTRAYLGVPEEQLYRDPVAAAVFDPENGPLWYRGMIRGELKQKEIDELVKMYDVDRFVLGHTPVRTIISLFKGKVIPIDVPHTLGEKFQKALLIENHQYFAVDLKGNKQRL